MLGKSCSKAEKGEKKNVDEIHSRIEWQLWRNISGKEEFLTYLMVLGAE